MPQKSVEAEEFIKRIVALPPGPGVSLDDALKPCLDDEYTLRQLWASDRGNERLKNNYIGLVDLFDAPAALRTTRARVVKDEEDLSAKYVMPLNETIRRVEGVPCVVNDIDEFKKNWAIFTEGSLSQLLDWNNVVAAGGSVLACLAPLSDEAKTSKRAIRKFYHNSAYPTSDVDLFLYGMNAEQAEKKIVQIYEAVRDSVPWDVTCVRTKHTVSIHSQYPYRSVQIVLRLYSSPAEILAGFDIDAPCVAYDGSCVWANPRAVAAMMRQCNTIDVTRRSPSYEVRLAKYAGRGFEVFVPTLERNDVDPTIYERSIARIEGLARLLVFEKLADTTSRYMFLEGRRQLRGRPDPLNRYYNRHKRVYKGDLKADMTIGGLEMNDYDVAVLHIPYGPGWDARRIDKLIYSTDLGMNSTFNPKNNGRRLHRHPAFFGTMQECLEDCCELCPEAEDDEERELQEKEDEQYIRGRISFIEENPGRQTMSGSFNPIDDGEWAEQVYMGDVEKLFRAISLKDRPAVQAILALETFDATRRDHVGRSPLHVAILCGAMDIACDLIDAGVRITARLVDGRTALHLAAQYGQVQVIQKLFEKSHENELAEEKKKEEEELAKKAKEEEEAKDKAESKKKKKRGDGDEDGEGDEEEEDWMSVDIGNSEGEDDDDDDDDKKKDGGENQAEAGGIPEDEESEPDILDVNAEDWDISFSPLFYAITAASVPAIETLIAEGADVHLTVNRRGYDGGAYNALSCTFFIEDKQVAIQMVERLLEAGCTSSEADQQVRTVFHTAVHNEKLHLVKAFLEKDPNAETVLNYPAVINRSIITPLTTAVQNRSYSAIATLLAHGASLSITEEEAAKAEENIDNYYRYGSVSSRIVRPLEVSLAWRDEIAGVLISAGANVCDYIRQCVESAEKHKNEYYTYETIFTILDWVEYAQSNMRLQIQRYPDTKRQDSLPDTATKQEEEAQNTEQYTGWKKFCHDLQQKQVELNRKITKTSVQGQTHHWNDYNRRSRREAEETLAYLNEIERLLLAKSAKTRRELVTGKKKEPEQKVEEKKEEKKDNKPEEAKKKEEIYFPKYQRLSYNHQTPKHLDALYDELFEAAFKGDSEKVQKLCLPSEGVDNENLLLVAVKMMTHKTVICAGMTPFVAAVRGRRWETARLILAIASAQYDAPEDDTTFSLRDIFQDEYEDSYDSEMDYEEGDAPPPKINFINIAKKKTSVTCNIAPRQLLEENAQYFMVDPTVLNPKEPVEPTTISLSPLMAAIYEDDFDAFRHIANLYMSIKHPIGGPYTNILDRIISLDRPEMLDCIIRLTGQGIDHVILSTEEDDSTNQEDLHALMKRKRIYLGLTVHGKKRADLAKRNDPSASYGSDNSNPLVWQATQWNSFKIIDYLASERPLDAYRFYASGNSDDDRAERLRRTPNLAEVLPGWLGWKINVTGESPLTAAVISQRLEMFSKLIELSPKVVGTALHEKVKFYGHNLFLLACELYGCKVELLDLLLKYSISPAERDLIDRQNAFHILANRGANDLISHLLNALPRDVVEALLAQQTKFVQNTPLHVAIKRGRTHTVELLLPLSSHALNMRDMNGFTPLHVAVKEGYSHILERLLKVYPKEALHIENGIGEIPREAASFRDLLERTKQGFRTVAGNCSELNRYSASSHPRPFDVDHLEKELPRLRATLQELQDEGKLPKGSELSNTLLSFAGMMEAKLPGIKAQREEERELPKQKTEEEEKAAAIAKRDKCDTCDWPRTLKILAENEPQGQQNRQLVHLLDVQKSIQLQLKLTDWQKNNNNGYGEDHDGLEDEDSEEVRLKSRMLVGHAVSVTNDV